MNKLKQIREERGMTQEQLAREVDLSLFTIYRYEQQQNLEKASLENVKRIAKALNVEPAIFLK